MSTEEAPFLAAYDDLDATIDSLDLPEEREEELRRHIARVLSAVAPAERSQDARDLSV